MPLLFASALLWAAPGCAPLPDPPEDPATSTDTAAPTAPAGFTLEVHTAGLGEGEPAAGACTALVDPSPTFVGQPAAVLGEVQTGDSGVAVFGDVHTDSVVGLHVIVGACDGSDTPTLSTIAAADYAGLGEGDVLREAIAWWLEPDLLAELGASAAAAGFGGDLAADGLVLGWVVDPDRAPIGGATVTCGGCGAWYVDADASDGWFAGPGGANTATEADADAWFVIPAPPAAMYLADDGGVHGFTPAWVAGAAGIATIVTLASDPP